MIRVLVVDDSALVQRMLAKELAKAGDIEVVGTAVDPYVARERLATLKPDVITLDIEMPRMDGLTFLEKLMAHHPLPVVVVSSLSQHQSPTALRALALGAVEVVPKPGSQFSTPNGDELVRAVRTAAAAKVRATPLAGGPAVKAPTILETTDKVIALGASTGGPRALEIVLKRMPAACPGIVIAQHMPEYFTAQFASRLNAECPMEVREAKDGDVLVSGLALLAPGGSHLVLVRSGGRYVVHLKDGPPVHFQKPAVDVLFHSVARAAGANAVGAILTGMGQDGAAGLLAMRQAGAFTAAESERTATVYGMPKVAAETGAACEVVDLEDVAGALLSHLSPAGTR
jgi:two-component system chemotaxis response regulator CheB